MVGCAYELKSTITVTSMVLFSVISLLLRKSNLLDVLESVIPERLIGNPGGGLDPD